MCDVFILCSNYFYGWQKIPDTKSDLMNNIHTIRKIWRYFKLFRISVLIAGFTSVAFLSNLDLCIFVIFYFWNSLQTVVYSLLAILLNVKIISLEFEGQSKIWNGITWGGIVSILFGIQVIDAVDGNREDQCLIQLCCTNH